MSLTLESIVVGESGEPWEAAGFTVVDGSIHIGAVAVVCTGDDDPSSRWGLSGDHDLATLDGIAVVPADQEVPTGPSGPSRRRSNQSGKDGEPATLALSAQVPDTSWSDHRNRVVDLDHVVLRSPDLDRTTAMFENQGIECRRVRDVPFGQVPMQQRFFRIATGDATSTILELVGPVEPTAGGPATIWGLACVVDDIDAAADALGDRCSPPKDAVQPGRRIATIRTRDLGIGLTLALMTPR